MYDEATILTNAQALLDEVPTYSRDPAHPPQIIAVTKTQPVECILPLKKVGIFTLGENHAQEILEKFPALSADFKIHMIGRLQTNKIKYIIGRVCSVQSLDSLHLAQAIDGRSQAAGISMPVLLQVNIGREPQKGGVAPEDTIPFARECARLPGLSVQGLMAVMPAADDPQTIRPLFAQMRLLFEHLREEAIANVNCRELSMGMTHDWRVAAQEGATMIRVGTAIFGERG